MTDLVHFEALGAVGVITLDRPPVNAISRELTEDLDAAVAAAADDAIRAVIVTGSPHFAAGADIKGFQDDFASGSSAEVGSRLSEVISRLETLPKPTLAAVRGYALGGGLELAMGCDFRLLSDDAQVGQPEIKLGIIPGAGGTQRLTRLVGLPRARDIIYSGRTVDAQEALAIGLADEVVPADDLEDRVVQAATEWAAGPTRAIAAAKKAINEGLDGSLSAGLAVEADAFRDVFRTEDARKGVSAFVEKRQPDFTGR